MKINKFYIIATVLFSLLITSCNNEDTMLLQTNSTKHNFEINASLASLEEDDDNTRASLVSNMITQWAKGDGISVINLSTKKVLGGNLVAQTAGTKTTFTGTVTGSISAGDKLAFLYPAKNITTEKTLTSSDFVYDLFGSQTTTTPFVAKYTYTVPNNSKDITLSDAEFSFLSAYLKMNLSTLPGNTEVTNVTIENMGTSLSCMPNADGSDLTATGTLGDINIDLSATTKEQGYTVVKFSSAPIAKQSQDRTVSVTCDGFDYVSSMVSNEIKSNAYVNVNVSAFEKEIPYVTFHADAEQTLKMDKAMALYDYFEYSVNGGDWAEIGRNPIMFGGVIGNLRLRGKCPYGTAVSEDDYSTLYFGNNTEVQCSGDIRTLVDYENYNTVDCSKASFYFLFSGCTSLTTAPELPATTLTYSRCYSRMFYRCTSLTTAPKLPATTLTPGCYSGMFYGCTSLTTAPELPATTLTVDCYSFMFYGCTSLTTAPKLPATTLTPECYSRMFNGCSKLNSVKMMATDISASYCLEDWLSGVSSTGTFVKNSALVWNKVGDLEIPSNWVIKSEDN